MPLPDPDYTDDFDIEHEDFLQKVIAVGPTAGTIPVTPPATLIHWTPMELGEKQMFHQQLSEYADVIGESTEADFITSVDTAGGIAGFQMFDFQGTMDTTPESGFQVVDVGGAITGGTATGLANDATVYTAAVVVDGGASQPIAVTGSAAQTYTTLINELNADTTGATWAIVNGNVQCTSDTTGTSSSIAITDTDLFSSLTAFVAINAAVPGQNAGSTGLDPNTTYTAEFLVDGITTVLVSIDGSAAQTYDTFLTELNTDLGGDATASVVDGNLYIQSDGVTGGGTTAIEFQEGTLFGASVPPTTVGQSTALAGFFRIREPRPEVADFDDFLARLGPTGAAQFEVFWDTFNVVHNGNPPFQSPHSGTSSTEAYHDPFTDDWKRLIDDVVIV